MPPKHVKGDLTVTNFGYPTPKERTMSNELPDRKIEEWNPIETQGVPEDNGQAGGLQLVGKDVKTALDAIDKIRGLVGGIVTEIPQVVLVGDQSSGKSSLLSAIAGINLPRGGSTCTRCPTNIKTSEGPAWECEVSLHISFRHDQSKKATGRSYHFWAENTTTNVVPFKIIRHESELEEVLRWAQIALLNPDTHPREFVPDLENPFFIQHKQLRENKAVKEQAVYSPNVIAISISAPGLPALSFFDLPGLIVSAASDQYLPDAFRTMTRQYVRHEKSLIICAMAMHIDPQSSTARLLIRQEKAEHRCIGVLTNTDRVTDVSEYTEILQGHEYKLKHGYFVTRQPGPDWKKPPGPQYHESAREYEKRFFEESGFWREGGEWACFRDRCGTEVIQKYLSKTFVDLIYAWYALFGIFWKTKLIAYIASLTSTAQLSKNSQVLSLNYPACPKSMTKHKLLCERD
jgi:GTP-binding protein EngB required for normal cell division